MDHPLLYVIFIGLIAFILALDLGFFNKDSHVISIKEATYWSLGWISLSMIFSGVVYLIYSQDSHALGIEKFSQFQAAYWIEKALSVDNLFVFIVVFKYFQVPEKLEHTILSWGVLGAIVMRLIFIFAGVALIEYTYTNKILTYFGMETYKYDINLIMTAFGAFLVFAAIKTAREALSGGDDEEEDYSKSAGARLINKIFGGRVLPEYHDKKFTILKDDGNGKLVKYATMLLVVIAVIEITDLLFAVDSIPAIFAIAPNDPFILYSSNIFAIMGLRSLYFLLANFMHMFRFLPFGLSLILAFIGAKMLVSPIFHIEATHSLLVVVSILVISIVSSLLIKSKDEEAETL